MNISLRASLKWVFVCALAVTSLPIASAIHLDLNSDASIKKAAKIVASGMTAYYTGHLPGDVPGNLPPPYFWWESGAMFGALIDYWFYTGDSTWNKITTQALLHQASASNNFMPPNQSRTLGNDDQSFWGMSAMAAAERNFPNPPSDQPQWLALAQGVFNSQAVRWDTETCNGGLKWQIFRFNNGYNYKNTISNGCFFSLAARLALYTGNQTYADWAVKAWDWTHRIGLMSPEYKFFDGSDDKLNCSQVNHMQWTYNAGVYLHGAANMYNYTHGDDVWRQRIIGIVKGLQTFFFENTDIMFELGCEPQNNCLVDQRSFKAYLARWMAATTQLAPFTSPMLMPRIRASAVAAANACTGGADRQMCGLKWTIGGFDGSTGVGEQMAALEIIQSNLISKVKPPYTEKSGGTSKGDPSAGGTSRDSSSRDLSPITAADRAGAVFITLILMAAVVGGSYFVMSE
ncbi:hypothetical protein LOZ53_003214 [Ophidiomyces ophidiicola]|nr:hypothetical protein LOZ55_005218 [Ophidiomyces ophidiicola]KAI1983841.1 hypothetical protein LOZ54_004752 [Ophidiomyces ophidiicola]KAI1990335.1 hypothetical protein LOZ53_003214 [Ophidiomyces ophidiicola]KAI1998221.1 hypothetical protein LOZ51_002899 [Ophidiomyces ophidiicola]